MRLRLSDGRPGSAPGIRLQWVVGMPSDHERIVTTSVFRGVRLVAVLMAAAGGAGCAAAAASGSPPIVQPGAPGREGRIITREEAVELSAVRHTEADVRFMQGMIHHHAQALDMTALLQSRTASEAMRALARRIELSQADEIEMMGEWLAARGADVPGPHAHHAPGAPRMPGMLTQEEMDRLAASSGADFDRLFLELMIAHHAGALVMVHDLFSTPGAGQESEIFKFASDVEADQQMEIARMRAMLQEHER
jgi:uncharacterized protein (DUF305 family)